MDNYYVYVDDQGKVGAMRAESWERKNPDELPRVRGGLVGPILASSPQEAINVAQNMDTEED